MMTEANIVISELLQTKTVNRFISKCDPRFRDDLKGELSLILMNQDPQRIRQLKRDKKINYYALTILSRLALGTTSSFYKKYIKCDEAFFFEEIEDRPEFLEDTYALLAERQTKENLETAILSLINKKNLNVFTWYEREMVKLYIEVGSYRKMQVATGIPLATCYNTVNSVVKKIKQALNAIYENIR